MWSRYVDVKAGTVQEASQTPPLQSLIMKFWWWRSSTIRSSYNLRNSQRIIWSIFRRQSRIKGTPYWQRSTEFTRYRCEASNTVAWWWKIYSSGCKTSPKCMTLKDQKSTDSLCPKRKRVTPGRTQTSKLIRTMTHMSSKTKTMKRLSKYLKQMQISSKNLRLLTTHFWRYSFRKREGTNWSWG